MDISIPELSGGFHWILYENAVQFPLVDLSVHLASGKGRIKAVHICGDSGDDARSLKSPLESSHADSEFTAPTGVVAEIVFVKEETIRGGRC